MGKSLLLPLWLGIVIYILQVVIVSAAPETAGLSNSSSEIGCDVQQSLMDPRGSSLTSSSSHDPKPVINFQSNSIFACLPLKDLKAMQIKIKGLLMVPNVSICLLLFLLKRTAFQSEDLFYQYASEKFDLKLSSTPSFRLALSCGSVLATSLLLPIATIALRRLSFRHQLIELAVVRVSFTLMAITFFNVWAAPNPIRFGIGTFPSSSQGLEPFKLMILSGLWVRTWRGNRACLARLHYIHH